jgi:VanZ family protein
MIPFKKFIPGIAWFFLVLLLICLPSKNLPDADDWLHKIYFDKWVHIGLFGILTLLFMYPIGISKIEPRAKWVLFLKIAIAVSVWGITTEFVQKYFVAGRSFDIYDWLADSTGAAIALLFSRKKYLR